MFIILTGDAVFGGQATEIDQVRGIGRINTAEYQKNSSPQVFLFQPTIQTMLTIL